MKERPIIFSGEMVRAILEGRKTQTRRVVNVRGLEFIGGSGDENDPAAWGVEWPDREGYASLADGIPCPYGHPGDRLWVRETWALHEVADMPVAKPNETWTVYYRSDKRNSAIRGRWRPSIHMPRWASRILLEVTDVRVERVQDISEDDAWEEGCDETFAGEASCVEPDPGGWFRDLWDSINAKRGYGWDGNPWVWVVSFKKIEP